MPDSLTLDTFIDTQQPSRPQTPPARNLNLDSFLDDLSERNHAPKVSDTLPGPGIRGLITPGNIDLDDRPVVRNSDGSFSTVRSMSIGTPQGEVLIPTVSDDGRIMKPIEAIAQYRKTGKHLGIFRDAASATAYAQQLHQEQADKYAAQAGKLSSSLPSPEMADQMATAAGRVVAEYITRPTRAQMEAAAPTVPPAPIPYELQTDAQQRENAPVYVNPRTGQRSPMVPPGQERGPLSILDMPITGSKRAAEGVEHAAEPGLRAKAGGASEVLRGGFEAATPFIAGDLAVAPVKTVASVGAGMVSQEAVEAGMKKLGLPKEYAAIAGDLAGIIAGVATHKVSTKTEGSLKAALENRYQETQARKTASATITGREAYQPKGDLNLETFLDQQEPPVKEQHVEAETITEGQPALRTEQSSGIPESGPAAPAASPEAIIEAPGHPADVSGSVETHALPPKPLHEMSPGELDETIRRQSVSDRELLHDLFGPDGAKKYERLERKSNSTTDPQGADQAYAELEKMQGSLSEEQRKRLFGIGTDDYDLEHAKAIRSALGRVDTSSPAAMGDSLKWAVSQFDPEKPTANPERYAQLRYAAQVAHERGWDTSEIMAHAYQGMASRFADQNDAAMMLERFRRPGDINSSRGEGGRPDPARLPEAEASRIGDAETARRQPSTPPAYGRELNIAVPGESTSYPARYSVREASDVEPSNNPFSFEANPAYEHQNDRDYRNNAQLSSLVAEHAGEKFNPEFMTADSPTAEHGAPIIDTHGNVLGGNSRAMTLNRVYRFNPEGAAAYRKVLAERAPSYGIDPAEFDRFQNPVLVRELTGNAEPQAAITDFNKGGPAALSPAERAVADGRRLSASTVNELAGMLADVGDDSTLAQALRGENGAEVVNRLVDDGIITPQEKNGLLDERGVLTGEAKDRIARMLVGRLFDSPAAFNNTPPELRAKLERVAPHVLRVEDRPDWNITSGVREAVNALADARAHGIQNLEDLARQQSIGRNREYSPEAIAIAQTLKKRPLVAAKAFRRYANDEALSRDGSQVSFFTPPTQREAFDDAFRPSVLRDESGSVSPDLLSLGARQFWNDDVAPKLAAAARGIVSTADDILKWVAPRLRSEAADQAGLILRSNLADLARRYDQAVFALRDARRALGRMPIEDRYEFIRRVEAGAPQESPELDAIARVVRQMLDNSRDRVRALGTGALQKYISDYFPHIWADPERASQIFASFFRRGPMEGNKSFLKQRTIPTFEEGIKAGLKPVSDNPIDLVLATVRQMEKYTTAHANLEDWKASGLAKFVDARTGVVPAGWEKIVDPIGTVYGPSVQNIPEYPNRDVYNALQKVADDLGLKHDRTFTPGGPALGYARRAGSPDISTRHGTAEDVLAHEIGHHLDWKYGLGDRFENYPGGDTAARIKAANKTLWTKGTAPEARRAARATLADLKSEIAKRITIKKELRALADLREGRKEYVRNRAEKMAAMAQAWVGAPEKFQRVAPTVHAEFSRFLESHPELAPLQSIEGGMTLAAISQPYDVGGLVIRGHWYAPEEAARILNNHLSPGLGRFALYRASMGLNNAINLFYLGLSGFHASKTAFEAAVSKGAIGVEALMRGQPGEAAKNFIAAPAAPFTAFARGTKMLREWYDPGSQGELIGKLMDSLTSGGARAMMDETYRTQAGDNMIEALRKGNLIGAGLRLPFAAMEVPTRILMDHIVPRMKMGTMADIAEADLRRLGPDASFDDVRRAMSEIVNSVDNRMGEVSRDNLFWNRYARDLGMFLMRADQYFLGTVREIGGAGVDLVRQPVRALQGKPVNLKRLSYVASMLMMHMATSSIYQRLHTGKWPDQGEDYFYPKNGLLDENGHPQRVALWSYLKDVDSFFREPVRTLENKTAPTLSMFSELLHNRDFFNTEIRHPDDPVAQQAADVTRYVGRQFEPRSVENLIREKSLGATPDSEAEQLLGIGPAPAAVNQTPAERLAHQLAAASGEGEARTKGAAEKRDLLRSLTRSVRAGKGTPPDVVAAKRAGKLSSGDISRAILSARRTPLQAAFNELGILDAIRVYGEASPDERKKLKPLLTKKGRAAMDAAAPADKQKLAKQIWAALAAAK